MTEPETDHQTNRHTSQSSPARPWWRRKWVWVIVVILALPYLAVGSVKLYRNYQFEQNKEEVLADLKRLVMTDFSNRDDPSKPLPGIGPLKSFGRPWDLFIKCDSKVFLNPYEQWEEAKGLDEKVFLQRKLIKLGGVNELAQWFACQGIKTRFVKPEITIRLFFSRWTRRGFYQKPLWQSGLPYLYDWMGYSDQMEVHFHEGQIESVEFSTNSL